MIPSSKLPIPIRTFLVILLLIPIPNIWIIRVCSIRYFLILFLVYLFQALLDSILHLEVWAVPIIYDFANTVFIGAHFLIPLIIFWFFTLSIFQFFHNFAIDPLMRVLPLLMGFQGFLWKTLCDFGFAFIQPTFFPIASRAIHLTPATFLICISIDSFDIVETPVSDIIEISKIFTIGNCLLSKFGNFNDIGCFLLVFNHREIIKLLIGIDETSKAFLNRRILHNILY